MQSLVRKHCFRESVEFLNPHTDVRPNYKSVGRNIGLVLAIRRNAGRRVAVERTCQKSRITAISVDG